MVIEDQRSHFGPRRPRAARNKNHGPIAAVAAVLLGGCSLITDSFLTNGFSGDSYPIAVETSSGAIVVGMRAAGEADRIAVVDLLSPFSLTDPGAMVDPSVSYVDLTLLGKAGAGAPGAPVDLAATVPRAQLSDVRVVGLHPCDASGENATGSCHVGPLAAPRPFQALIGADALAGDAVRLRLTDDQMFILADIGGSDAGRTLACDAVFNSPYRGGGTLVIAGTELPFGNRRITLQSCLGPDPDPGTPLRQRGASALLVVSTSVGISILGQSAYERYRLAVANEVVAPPFDALPLDSVYLPSGAVANGRRATIDRLALVANSSSNTLSPCRQLYAHRFLTEGNCSSTEDDCPCKDGSAFCAVPATLELSPAQGLAVLVVPDTDPTLQALRTELRPDQPEVDGLLGTDALRTAEIDVDYPHDRLVARCTDPGCIARPQLALDGDHDDEDRDQATRCIARQRPQP
jgi:hypothetical protein